MKRLLKVVILSVSLGTMVNNSASVILGSLQNDFPMVDSITLQCFVTYPTLMVVLFTLIGGVMTALLGTRFVLLTGLVIFTISGMIPMFLNDFNQMLISRLCLGAGLGMVSPLAVTLITDYYVGEERVTMLGQQFAIGNMGQTMSMLVVGFLAAAGWRYTFWIYSLGAVVFLLVFLFLPKYSPQQVLARSRPSKPFAGIRCNWKVIGLALLMFTYNTTYLTMYSNLALIMKSESIGSATMVGYALAFMTASGMVVGLFFGKLYQRFGKTIGVISAAMVALAFVLMIRADSMFSIAVSLIIMGSGNSLLMPFGFYHVSKAAPLASSSFCMSIVQAAVSAGSFCSPYIYGYLVKAFGCSSGRFTFVLASVVLAAGVILLGGYVLKSRKQIHRDAV